MCLKYIWPIPIKRLDNVLSFPCLTRHIVSRYFDILENPLHLVEKFMVWRIACSAIVVLVDIELSACSPCCIFLQLSWFQTPTSGHELDLTSYLVVRYWYSAGLTASYQQQRLKWDSLILDDGVVWKAYMTTLISYAHWSFLLEIFFLIVLKIVLLDASASLLILA